VRGAVGNAGGRLTRGAGAQSRRVWRHALVLLRQVCGWMGVSEGEGEGVSLCVYVCVGVGVGFGCV